MLIEDSDAAVQFFLGHNQRRRNNEMADPRKQSHAICHHLARNLIHNQRLAFHLVAAWC